MESKIKTLTKGNDAGEDYEIIGEPGNPSQCIIKIISTGILKLLIKDSQVTVTVRKEDMPKNRF